jgi:hypothetical protein
MAQHVLSLEVPDTMNKCILRIVDTSVYNTSISVKCPTLWITLPGFSYSVQFTDDFLAPGFMLNLTACDLEVQTNQCGTLYNDLPDGIYSIKYSVSPNELVYVEYNHLRITKALWKIRAILCDLDLAACDPPEAVDAKLKQIRRIQMFLQAAKAQVEFCHHADKGMALYNYSVKLLDKMNCSTCV